MWSSVLTLFSGSRATNFGGILSQGLRIAPPEAPVSGYMFGKGVYAADCSTKSAGECYSKRHGTNTAGYTAAYLSNGTGLLLLMECELGDPMLELTNASYNAGDEAKAAGAHSTWGQGKVGPSKWKDAGCIHPSLKGVTMVSSGVLAESERVANSAQPDAKVEISDTNVPNAYLMYNEYIMYNVDQIRMRYLLRVKMN
jgi:poly [ADP-ribose] polymerase